MSWGRMAHGPVLAGAMKLFSPSHGTACIPSSHSPDSMPVPWGSLAAAAVISGVTAFLVIAAFLRLIERMGMLVFAVYRILLAGVIAYVLL